MVSMVDKDGKLIPEQGGARSTSPAPVVIRKGLDIDKMKQEQVKSISNNVLEVEVYYSSFNPL
ncbi:translation factor [Streptococcus pneumoniae]|nr:translation factor [Streptococcus pneumoniae]